MENGMFTPVGRPEDFPTLLGRKVSVCGEEIAVFRTSDHRWFALENKNPNPKGGTLAEAIVSGHYIYDPLYDWKIDLTTGLVQAPDTGHVRTFPVREADGMIEVGVAAGGQQTEHPGGEVRVR
ncbi:MULTISPECIES: nitrite reductase (NAD(P)H) small subunit [Paenibacillus]|uniref:Nitrite reductase n=1 Tax=Paenibacillus campinasensis TaxID=66347 RepID=A0A268F398_9BACL|nr:MULTISPECIES: nitrite reductase (NAD(P)H) small subunit [Paenibacillus]PAD79839.1 nitrite reductase [Paenibacillus campinasensis]PAK53452.1 nitrite reductase [Paenibacillus sp. 7541]